MTDIDNGGMVSISSGINSTVISAQTKFKGTVTTEKPIRIDGYFEGDIDTKDVVTVSEGAEFKGNLKCRELNLNGKGSGTAVCLDLCNISESGSFDGKISTSALITVRGSKMNGEIHITG